MFVYDANINLQMYILVGVKPLPLAVCRLRDFELSGSLNQIGIKTGIHASINQMRMMIIIIIIIIVIVVVIRCCCCRSNSPDVILCG